MDVTFRMLVLKAVGGGGLNVNELMRVWGLKIELIGYVHVGAKCEFGKLRPV